MVSSINFLLNPDSPLQVDTNDDTLGGEVYCTENNRMPPFYFSIADIITNFNNSTREILLSVLISKLYY